MLLVLITSDLAPVGTVVVRGWGSLVTISLRDSNKMLKPHSNTHRKFPSWLVLPVLGRLLVSLVLLIVLYLTFTAIFSSKEDVVASSLNQSYPDKPSSVPTYEPSADDLTIPGSPISVVVRPSGSYAAFRDDDAQFYGGHAEGAYLWVHPSSGSTTVWGPENVPGYDDLVYGYTPVSNTLSGTGSAGDPWVVTTIVTVGSFGIEFIQRVVYVNGQDHITNDWTIHNTGSTSFTGMHLFHAADLSYSGYEYGYYDSGTGAIGGYNISTPEYQIFRPQPGVSASHYEEIEYGALWRHIGNLSGPGTGLSDSCRCIDLTDSMAGLEWVFNLTPFGTQIVQDTLNFTTAIPPTAVPTYSPTNTPTRTPTINCLRTPVPGDWPWCSSMNTPTAAPSAPAGGPIGAYPQSFYVHPTSTAASTPTATPNGWKGYFYDEGYHQATAMKTNGPESGLVILHYGQPIITVQPTPASDTWGTGIFPNCKDCEPPFHSHTDIQNEVLDFAQGFYDGAVCPTTHCPRLVLAVGTSNDFTGLPDITALPTQTVAAILRRHGQHWGTMVSEINYKVFLLGQSGYVSVQGANDIEVGFGDPNPTLGWTQGFEEVTRGGPFVLERRYFADSSCDDCYPYATVVPTRNPIDTNMSSTGHTWNLNQFVGATWANRAAYPVPQVYYPGPTPDPNYTEQAQQWQWVSMYSNRFCISLPQYGINEGLFGNIGFLGATGSWNYPAEYTGGYAWQRLWQALNGRSCTVPMPLSSGINPSPMHYATTAGYCIPSYAC